MTFIKCYENIMIMQKLGISNIEPRQKSKPNFLKRAVATGMLLLGSAAHAEEKAEKIEQKPPITLKVSSISMGEAAIRNYGTDAYAKLNVRWTTLGEGFMTNCIGLIRCNELSLYGLAFTSNLRWLGIDWLNVKLGYYEISSGGESRARDVYHKSKVEEQRAVAGLGFLPINSDGVLLYLEAGATIPTTSERSARTAVADDVKTDTTIANERRNEPGATWAAMLNLDKYVHVFHEGSSDMLLPMTVLINIGLPWWALPWTDREIPPALHLRAYNYERAQNPPEQLENRVLIGNAAIDYPFLTHDKKMGMAIYAGGGLDNTNVNAVLSVPLGIALRSYIGTMVATFDPLSESIRLVISLVIPSEFFDGLFFGADDVASFSIPGYVIGDMDMFIGYR